MEEDQKTESFVQEQTPTAQPTVEETPVGNVNFSSIPVKSSKPKNNLKTLVLAKDVPVYEAMGVLSLLNFTKIKVEFEAEIKNSPGNLEFQQGKEVVSLEKNVVSFSVEIKNGALFYCRL